MVPERWLVLTVSVPAEASKEDLVDALIALGGAAVEEDGPCLRTYLPESGPAEESIARARDLLEEAAGARVWLEWRWQAHEDWAEEWRRGLGPRRVGARLVVAPSWAVPDAGPGDVVLVIDPGMAFGTGEHATTRGVLRLLERTVRAGERALDVGAGSGILSIAAARLGAGRVLGIESDPDAVATARANAERNGVAGAVEIRQGTLDPSAARRLGAGSFDLILANILSGVIVPLLPVFGHVLAAGGRAIVSGILEREAPEVIAAAGRAGFRLGGEDREEDWWSGLFTRSAGSGT